ncbi:hypothetical protein OKW11_005024 [Pseudomonas baetica]|nr:hypothetical protein [Pseudomonas baetica]
MSAYLQCLSHTPPVGHVDPLPAVLAEVDGVMGDARQRITQFDPELVILFAPDHYNDFFYDVMPSFCIGMAAHAIGDFGTAVGPLSVPRIWPKLAPRRYSMRVWTRPFPTACRSIMALSNRSSCCSVGSSVAR